MAKYKINKEVLLQESVGEVVRGGLQKYMGVNYDEKNGYKTQPNGNVTYNHPDTIVKQPVTQTQTPTSEMKSMDQFEKDYEKAGELNHH